MSCKKFVEADPPRHRLEFTQVFSTDASATSAACRYYLEMAFTTLQITGGGASIYLGLSADELYPTVPNLNYDPFYTNSMLPDTEPIRGATWVRAYRLIVHANAVMEGLNQSQTLTPSVKSQLEGEMLTGRAMSYFHLVTLFGPVPLITGTDFMQNNSAPRADTSLIWQQMVSDLEKAVNLLKPAYPSAGKFRINRHAASAMLARVHLYRKNWEGAEAMATTVINAGTYSLAAPAAAFAMNSPESIFHIWKENNNTYEGNTFIPTSSTARPNLAITTSLFNAFEAGDLRKTAWINRNTVSGITYHYPFKYKSRISPPLAEYLIVFRLAEQYLIRAEARMHKGDIQGSISDLNTIRTRAGLPSLPATLTSVQLAIAIEQERRVEL
ncbi:MAG TPA: RagB/SusD family nutrient uptake outer membrane protein, partial [Flavisolibacter sp.]|nr:RagB/SusD family nutrient uptake outer membrane protein [Flavisolibacter sp.]